MRLFWKRKVKAVPDDMCPYFRIPCIRNKCHMWDTVSREYIMPDGKREEKIESHCSIRYENELLIENRMTLERVLGALERLIEAVG